MKCCRLVYVYYCICLQVESMTSLLVGLTSRLARVEGEAATLKRKEDMAAIRSKQVKLQTQLAEAKCLQVYCRCSSKVAFAGVTRTVFCE